MPAFVQAANCCQFCSNRADAAGLPIYPGLVKFDDVVTKGLIDHAIRMTGPNSRAAYQPPATHYAPAGDKDVDSPWMGMRLRLNR
jgi:hypothetical protein